MSLAFESELTHTLSTLLEIKIYKIIILMAVLFECKIWYFCLRGMGKMRVFGNKLFRILKQKTSEVTRIFITRFDLCRYEGNCFCKLIQCLAVFDSVCWDQLVLANSFPVHYLWSDLGLWSDNSAVCPLKSHKFINPLPSTWSNLWSHFCIYSQYQCIVILSPFLSIKSTLCIQPLLRGAFKF